MGAGVERRVFEVRSHGNDPKFVTVVSAQLAPPKGSVSS